MATPIKLEDLAPATVTIRIVTNYGRELELPVKMLTWHEWNMIGAEVVDPSPDDMEAGGHKYWTRWNAGKNTKEFDPANPDYLKAKEDAKVQRNYRRLLYALEKGGNDVRRGDTIEEQVQNFIAGVSIEIAGLLIVQLEELSTKGRVGVFALADSFRGGRVQGNAGADMSPHGLDAEPVG